MKNALLLLPALALLSCTPVEWHKYSGNEALDQDLSACRKQAQDRINGMYGAPTPSSLDPRFGADNSRPSPADRQLLQAQAVGTCMREKGYALKASPGDSPAAPAGAAR
jgi:hypothetical protein